MVGRGQRFLSGRRYPSTLMTAGQTPTPGAEFYDRPGVETAYFAPRPPFESPVETLEAPAVGRAIGAVTGLRVLDLGCGDGALGADLLARGAASYHGVDASATMVARAPTCHGRAAIRQQRIEDLELAPESFDLAVSLRALHYVADLPAALARVTHTLAPGGRLIYTHEHPVITCHEAREPDGRRGSWVVDDYFASGPRQVIFLGAPVTKYHRTIEQHLDAVAAAGLEFRSLSECPPQPQAFGDRQDEYRRRSRIPLFLLIAAERRAR